MLYDDADARGTHCRTVDADISDDEKGVIMTNEQAIAKLSAIYGYVEMVKDGVFVSKKGSNFEMFRIEGETILRRVDVDFHAVEWEVVG